MAIENMRQSLKQLSLSSIISWTADNDSCTNRTPDQRNTTEKI